MKILLALLLVLMGCTHFAPDPYPNHAESNYKRVEFDIIDAFGSRKEIGIANVLLETNANLNDYTIRIHGIYKGQIFLKGTTCGIDISKMYNGPMDISLGDIMSKPMPCGIDVIINTEKIGNKEHKIVEHGFININTIVPNISPLVVEYTIPTAFGELKTYKYIGQASYQRQEGGLTNSEYFVLTTKSNSGKFRIAGCGYVHEGGYFSKSFELPIKYIYKKDSLSIKDSCDFNISIIPDDEIYSYRGHVLINIYGNSVVKLQPSEFEIDKNKLTIKARDIVILCIINDVAKIDNECSIKNYAPDTEYWIVTVTSNGRKNIYSIKNDNIDWSE